MAPDPAMHRHWPLFGLRVRTPRLELRYPDDELLAALAEVAARGVHDPATMPFGVPWTREQPDVLRREYGRHAWAARAAMAPDDWKLHLAVVVDGEAVGVQDAFAKRFGVTRSFETGSWLGRDFQGRGIGTEMRAAVLHLGFAGLGARESHSGCWSDNPASAGVSRKLGYVDNGWETLDREGVPARMTKLLLTRDAWAPDRRDDIVIEGLDPCREMLGI